MDIAAIIRRFSSPAFFFGHLPELSRAMHIPLLFFPFPYRLVIVYKVVEVLLNSFLSLENTRWIGGTLVVYTRTAGMVGFGFVLSFEQA